MPVVTVNLRTNNNEFITIFALTSPVICSALTQASNQGESIDILIGSYYYWDMVGNETIRGEEGPIALSTSGWVLSGPVNVPSTSSANTAVVTSFVISGESITPIMRKKTTKW